MTETIAPSASCTKVLIVEDEYLIALDIESELIKAGYQVEGPCASAAEAMVTIASERPDVILMDIRIKGDMDGIETARRVTSEYDIPVVFLTAHSDSGTVTRARESEPFGYLPKPFHPGSVVATIEIALNKHNLERELRDYKSKLAAIVGTIGDGLIVTDQNSTIRFMNPAAEEITGWSMSDARDLPVSEVLPIVDPVSGVELDDLVPFVIASEEAAAIPAGMQATARGSRKYPVEGHLAPSAKELQNGGCLITFRDLSKRVEDDAEASHIFLLERTEGEIPEATSPAAVIVEASLMEKLGRAGSEAA
jgi:PAS domain S-box-containing protein